MKKSAFLTRLMTTAFFGSLLIIGCKKETSDKLSTQEEEQVAVFSAESEVESQGAFDDVFDNVLGVNGELGIGGVGIFGRTTDGTRTEKTDSLPSCAQITITPLLPRVFPKTVVIDFGSGCTSHGHLRAGKITTVYTGPLSEPGRSATTTFDHYRIDSITVEGTHTISNTTTPGAIQRQFKTEISNAKLSRANGDYQEWNATRLITQIEGNGTLYPTDDIFRITGNSTGKTKRGNLLVSWTSEIQEPLIKRFGCRWFSKGTIKTGRTGLPANTPWVGILDFGNGTCDNKATLTVNGVVHQITLH
jgi:hypothetical protein